MDEKGKPSGHSYYSQPVAEVFAAEIVGEFAPKDATVQAIAKMFPKTKDQIPELKKWLMAKIARKE